MDRQSEMVGIEREFMDCVRVDTRGWEKSIAIAYLVLQLKKEHVSVNPEKEIKELCSVIRNETVRYFVYEMMNGVDKSVIEKLYLYDESVLTNYIIYSNAYYFNRQQVIATPQSVCKLAAKILDIKEGEEVIDNCTGIGSFIVAASEMQPHATYCGVELHASSAAIAEIRSSLIASKCHVILGNALEDNFEGKKFDKGFSDHPWGVRIKDVYRGEGIMRLYSACPELSRGNSTDWIFNYKLSEMLAHDGMGVAVMSLGSLWNTLDKPIREVFVKNGKIKAVIKLPAKLLSYSTIPMALIVLGHNDGAIRFVDASQEYEEGRRQNKIGEQNIANILLALNEDSEISRLVSLEEIARNDFNFDPTRYNEAMEEIANGVPFRTIIKRITRGAPLAARELDDIVSIAPTDYHYVMLTNIRNGVIDKELPYIKEIPTRFQKYCIHKGDLLLSKNGFPFKIAVADPPAEKTVLANGNLYIIELDTEKVDLYYIKAFLESEQGIAQLKRISVGTTIPNIGVAQLNEILIPMIPLEEQKKVSLRYQAVLDEIEYLKRKIEKAKDALKTIFNTRSGEGDNGQGDRRDR